MNRPHGGHVMRPDIPEPHFRHSLVPFKHRAKSLFGRKETGIKSRTVAGAGDSLEDLLKLFRGSFLTHTLCRDDTQSLQRHDLAGQLEILHWRPAHSWRVAHPWHLVLQGCG